MCGKSGPAIRGKPLCATVRCSHPILGPRTRPFEERLEFSLRPVQDILDPPQSGSSSSTEEEVQLRVQVEEEEIGEKYGKEQGEEQGERTNDQVAHMDDHAGEVKCAPTHS